MSNIEQRMGNVQADARKGHEAHGLKTCGTQTLAERSGEVRMKIF